MVPTLYELRDSDGVKALTQEAASEGSTQSFVWNVDPSPHVDNVDALFTALLDRHEAALRERYDLDGADAWPATPDAAKLLALEELAPAKLSSRFASSVRRFALGV